MSADVTRPRPNPFAALAEPDVDADERPLAGCGICGAALSDHYPQHAGEPHRYAAPTQALILDRLRDRRRHPKGRAS